MTILWTGSEQFGEDNEYWSELRKENANDTKIMGTLAFIAREAGDWRAAIDWYNKVADVTKDTTSKVASYQNIGYLAWAKLNSRTLAGAESIEMADRGIGA